MDKYIKISKTPKATLYLYEKNLVKVVTHAHQVLETEDMQFIQEARRKLIGKDTPYVILSIQEDGASITKDAREFASQKAEVNNRLALAIVAKSLAHRIIGNFFIQSLRPHTPARLFPTEAEALKWLHTFLK